jgi:ATP-dependent Lhr-like helicase
MRGRYLSPEAEEWCDRRLLARIHRYTLKRLRAEIEPVTMADYQRFLFRWQGLGREQREGRDALFAVLAELQGLALPAVVWEREILPARLADYEPSYMDELSASGTVVWWRPQMAASGMRRSNTVAASPISILPRAELGHWRALADPASAEQTQLSAAAVRVREALQDGGALFFVDLVEITGLLRVQVEDALGELVAHGLVTSDAFNGLRAVVAPQRDRPSFARARRRRGTASFDRAGRWALMPLPTPAALAAARSEAVEHVARSLLRRYGVVARAVLARETLLPSWRELVELFRRWEARGEIRGGRFVEPLGGEQFALTEAVEALRRTRRERDADEWVTISAADPLNLLAVSAPSRKVAAIGANRIVYRSGVPVAAALGSRLEAFCELDAAALQQVQQALNPARAFSGAVFARRGLRR